MRVLMDIPYLLIVGKHNILCNRWLFKKKKEKLRSHLLYALRSYAHV